MENFKKCGEKVDMELWEYMERNRGMVKKRYRDMDMEVYGDNNE